MYRNPQDKGFDEGGVPPTLYLATLSIYLSVSNVVCSDLDD